MDFEYTQNGDWITNLNFQKVSQKFKYDEMLTDSECSEDYDTDVFFEGIDLKRVPTDAELLV